MEEIKNIGLIALSDNQEIVELIKKLLEIEEYSVLSLLLNSDCDSSENLSSAYHFVNKQCKYLIYFISGVFLKSNFAMQVYSMGSLCKEEQICNDLIIIALDSLPLQITNHFPVILASQNASHQVVNEIKKIIKKSQQDSPRLSDTAGNVNIVNADIIYNSKFF